MKKNTRKNSFRQILKKKSANPPSLLPCLDVSISPWRWTLSRCLIKPRNSYFFFQFFVFGQRNLHNCSLKIMTMLLTELTRLCIVCVCVCMSARAEAPGRYLATWAIWTQTCRSRLVTHNYPGISERTYWRASLGYRSSPYSSCHMSHLIIGERLSPSIPAKISVCLLRTL